MSGSPHVLMFAVGMGSSMIHAERSLHQIIETIEEFVIQLRKWYRFLKVDDCQV